MMMRRIIIIIVVIVIIVCITKTLIWKYKYNEILFLVEVGEVTFYFDLIPKYIQARSLGYTFPLSGIDARSVGY